MFVAVPVEVRDEVRVPLPVLTRAAAACRISRRTLASVAIAQAFLLASPGALAQNDPCVALTGSLVLCSGTQAAGVATGASIVDAGGPQSVLASPPYDALDVRTLVGTIAPASGRAGILLQNDTGANVMVRAGEATARITIDTAGKGAGGIVVNGFGTPTQTQTFFGWAIPVGSGGNGGHVTVDSFADIATDGDGAHGVGARSRAGGYSDAVVATLQSFLGTGRSATFVVDTVKGDAANLGKQVAGSNGGTFVLSGAPGTYTYDLTGMALDTLEAGQHIDTSVAYTVASTVGLAPSEARLTLRVTRLEDGSLAVRPSTYFDVYGRAHEGADVAYVEGASARAGLISLRPDFDSYMTRLLSDSAVGGNGGNVAVTASGSLRTVGNVSLGRDAYGILAQSKGGTGLPGSGGVFSGDTGGAGSPGGRVTVINAATIHTDGDGAHGIVASSSGGDGGRGGGASFAGNGGAGGTGAKGGEVIVENSGAIDTGRHPDAYGILAQSVGGRGGEGGGGGWLGGGGGAGGAGTVNDRVSVTNSGRIVTGGDDSHGILAQNIGGFGGGGGGAGGIVALGSTGGNAGAGGEITLLNTGVIETGGRNANALMAQSIGGGGGSAGGTGGLVAVGGDGTAGGNGGPSTVTNRGALTASGLGARGIVAQSIGGGGGHGGDSGGLVAIGGDGATTSDGGKVVVINQGAITASSNAILAESIGGGGGVGGSSGGWFGVGGSGGGGGAGGEVSVTNSGDLNTSGRNAAALFAQSVGGGGGSGGNVVAVGAFASVAIGGAGGPGGDGKGVIAKSTGGTIHTTGVQSHGLYAQSVGGGGGNGGFAVALAAGKGLAASLAVGRAGGGGGAGGDVQLESASDVTTTADDAHGIFAQSVGGGGGTGGFAVAASAAVNGVAASFSVGGSGGAAGDGGKVEVGKDAPVTGRIRTEGADAYGIVAQSIGGGGGRGGLSVAGNISAGAGGSAGLSLAIGGGGGAGGAGDTVVLRSAADIATEGEKAYGVKAQSVGGGGGAGGIAVAGSVGGPPGSVKVSLAFGGDGGAGSSGGSVDVGLTGGRIETSGKDAHGVFAQSVGGGGGVGGLSIASNLGLGGKNVNLGVSVGGSGGSGSTGERVAVNNAAAIETGGEAAFGIFAQSIGGGGGQGGASFSGNGTLNAGQEGYNVNIGIAFGGAGGTGNRGGVVDVTNSGAIETRGTAAHGIFAESVGGGGGQGGSARTMSINFAGVDVSTLGKYASINFSLGGTGGAGGDGDVVTVINSGTIVTRGADAHGIYAQSVGAGGGTGGEGAHGFFGIPALVLDRTPLYQQVSVSMGGNAGAAGDGKAVNVVQRGAITASEQGSHGIFAQSVGGGGGAGGVGSIGFFGTVGIGGKGGASGDGGKVDVLADGRIETFGVGGYGVFAQSVGGGGGVAGNIDRGLPGKLDFGFGVGIVRNSGNGGSGGEVLVRGSGEIRTHGGGASAIFAQSVGGGGGLAGDRNGWGVAGSAGGNGSGDRITIDWTGTILTAGSNAHGIYAQSAGGEETTVYVYDKDGNRTGTTLPRLQNLGKDVSITVRGSVTASGEGSDAIHAQSEGAEGNGNIAVIVQDGGAVGGTGASAAGVRLVGGARNRIENSGAIGTVEGIRGVAIDAGTGDDTVINRGTITGSVMLGAGGNAFTNAAGGTFETGTTVALGAGNTLQNAGTLSPGGAGNVMTSALTGHLEQTGGTLAVDIDRSGRTADRLDVSGTATLGGRVSLKETNRGATRPGAERYTVVRATGGASDAGITLAAPRSAVNAYTLSLPNATDLVVAVATDFAPRGLNHNQHALGLQVNAIQLAGGSAAFAPLVEALVGVPDLDGLKTAYDRLSPAPYANQAVTATSSSLRFNQAMLSCRVRDGEYRFVAEGQCYWLRALGRQTTRDRTGETAGFDEDAGEVSLGAQMPVGGPWFIGAAMSQEWSSLESDAAAKSTGERTQFGAMLKAVVGNATASLGLTAGSGAYDSRRSLDPILPGVTASGRQRVNFAGAHLRLGYAFDRGSWYVRPLVDVGATWAGLDAFQESGAGGAGLAVQSQNETYGTVQPAVEVGGEVAMANGVLVRPFAILGATRVFSGDNPRITAQFQGAPVGVAPFTVNGEMDRTFADVTVGVDLLAKDGMDVRLVYAGQFASDTRTNAVAVKLSIPF